MNRCRPSIGLAATLLLTSLAAGSAMAAPREILPLPEDQVVLEWVGQVTNFPATPDAPLGTSQQYGYFTYVRGIASPFNAGAQNETTARFTFFNEVTTTRATSNGPLRIIDREGVTTIYLAAAAASFADPTSFQAGTPIQTSAIHQQIVVDTTSGVFTVVFLNSITSTSAFELDGDEYRLGRQRQMFRTTLTGHLNSPAPPSGQFGGYSVGISRK
jgi:hypothetical protein